ncbi:CatB-related O-acetyltransferase [Mucilaginibacter sp. L196]|uniref:CatB-related O-acetyltransferase n=1 Tax=Mucilaginibacter sp. L196 TaxID=1641870 RepID=UPI002739BD90|nr:CatB-related O-acetyltransferase [Mucilaginibacter sp. L196]
MGIKDFFFKKNKKETLSNKRIGERVVMSNSFIDENTSVGNDCFLHNVTIGSFSYLSSNVSIMNTKIGSFCSIGPGVYICLGRHPSDTFVSTSPVFFSPLKQCGTTFSNESYFKEMGNTVIGNDVWIGANSVVMDDINIGDGAIVGAGSIVTRDVPPYSIVVGAPAKVIKYRFTQDEIDFLMNFRWWEKDHEWVKANYKDFHNIKLFMDKNRAQ